ncbi:cytochrome b [Sphingomonas alba]|uniref:Cytochrome b/b6 domain-containing protein n=1 Tax=Sphingomonas alba TaxID=2908208 RepID=A0ABT0RKQ4_9SPHN|nr:cytochrome b/b6 domain-containing protein [Sphingomonas alba]MCL6683223.1 cytochrome b/b6 domain-containing protein [Sphingomonas alba]
MSDYMVERSTGLTAVRYKSIVVWIHWITAAVVVAQVIVGFLFDNMERGPQRADLFAWHKTIGALILILALVRLAVRLMNPPPPYPSDFPKWERFLAVWNHRLFYVLLIALPLTGLLAASGRAENGWVPLKFGLALPAIPGISPDADLGDVHVLLVLITLALVVLHVGAALYNQFGSPTNVADRMPPFSRSGRAREAD